MKITFKKEKRLTGLASIGEPRPDTKIKVDGLIVGFIAAPNPRAETNQWSIRLARVREPTQADPCPFNWVTLAKKFDTEPVARVYIQQGLFERIFFKLHQFPKGDMED